MFDLSVLSQYVAPALFAFCLTLVLVLLALKLFPRIGFMDRPHKYGLKRKPIPYYGGLVLYAGFVVSALIFVKDDFHLIGLIIGATLIAGISFLDDLKGLSPWIRLLVQVRAALVLVVAGVGIKSLSNPLGGALSFDQFQFSAGVLGTISVFGALFTVIWVVMLVNTMNFLDGLSGLPSGVTVIAALSLFMLSIRPGIHFDAKSVAFGAGAERRIEREQPGLYFGEREPALRAGVFLRKEEFLAPYLGLYEPLGALCRALPRFGQAVALLLFCLHAVDKKVHVMLLVFVELAGLISVYDVHLVVNSHPREAEAALLLNQLLERALLSPNEGREYGGVGPVSGRHDLVDNRIHALACNRNVAVRAVRHSYPRPQQAHVIVNFGDGSDR